MGVTEINIEYYWNKTFYYSKLIRKFTDSYTLIKVDGQDQEQ